MGGADKITTWKVFKIDEENGEIQLAPSTTKTQVKLQGANGYNNAVQLLNAACDKLYSEKSKGITAKNINLDDIEPLFNEEKLNNMKTKVNVQVAGYKKNNSYYPRIYEEEINSVINGERNESGLALSTPGTKLYERNEATSLADQTTETSATFGYFQANNFIKPYNTYYSYNQAFINSENYKEFQSAYTNMLNKNFWIATRTIETANIYCTFNVLYAYNSLIRVNMFRSDKWEYTGDSHALFPIVTVSSELIEKTENNFRVK